jgi:hypothetical protein
MSHPPRVEAISVALPLTGWEPDFAKIYSVVFDLPCHEYRLDGERYILKPIFTNSYRGKSP